MGFPIGQVIAVLIPRSMQGGSGPYSGYVYAARRLSTHLRHENAAQSVLLELHRHLYRTWCFRISWCTQFGWIPPILDSLRTQFRSTHKLHQHRQWTWCKSANRKGMDVDSGIKLHRIPSHTVLHERTQTGGQNAETLFLWHWLAVPSLGHSDGRSTGCAPQVRRYIWKPHHCGNHETAFERQSGATIILLPRCQQGRGGFVGFHRS